MSGALDQWRNCDACGAKMPVHDLVRTWCDACGWNVSDPANLTRNVLDRQIDALGRLHGGWLLDQVTTAPEAELRPRFSLATLTAFALSFLIVVANLLVGLAGLYLLIWGWPNIMFIIGGAIFLLASWFLRPRLYSVPKDCLAREDFPNLFGLTDDIAKFFAIKPVEHIEVDQEFNASMSEVGLRRTPVLTIGLPLWVSLTGEERVALIGHELAHRANHDPARSTVVGIGLSALDRWIYFMDPTGERTGGLPDLIAHLLMRTFGSVVGGLRMVLANLLFLERQRAEYLADHLAAKAAGSAAMVKLMRKFRLGDNLRAVAERCYYTGDSEGRSVLDAFGAFVRTMPEREMERMKRADEKENSRIDSSHPPTASRIKFIESRHFEAAPLILSDAQSAAIDNELKPFRERLSMKLMDRYFEQR